MEKRILNMVALTGVVIMLNACGGSGVCTDDRRYGLELNFYDHETGLPLCGTSFKITSGNYVEEGTLPSEGDFCNRATLLEERSGSYTILVEKQGYNAATLNVDVFSDQCHVITEKRDIDLESI
jgi:hypothetical protein